jgi:hypothetical protein
VAEHKPKSSGVFAAVCGGLFFLAFVFSFFVDIRQVIAEHPDWTIKAWLLFVSAVLCGWGVHRARTGDKGGPVGQITLNFVVAIVGATFALLALVAAPSGQH